jgi:hypothetical protein
MAGGDFATITPGGGPLHVPHEDRAVYEHIEGLCGEEEALLQVPPHEREAHHHERLKHVEHELDRAFQRLRHRAEKRGS